MASSCVPSIALSLDASHSPSLYCPLYVELSENRDKLDGNENIAVSDCKPDGREHNSMIGLDNKDNIDNIIGVSES